MTATIIFRVDSTTKTMVVKGPNISVQLQPNGSGSVDISDENRKTIRSLIFNQLELVDVDRT
jgi:hypothetical protein